MDTVTQNRITRKKLKKKIKRQASRRISIAAVNQMEIEKMRHRINVLERKNSDCAKLVEVAIRQILEVINVGEFSQHTTAEFNLGFVTLTYAGGKFKWPRVSLPDNDHIEAILKEMQ